MVGSFEKQAIHERSASPPDELSFLRPPGAWLVADLSLGAWRPNQVAAELFAQLPQEIGLATSAGPAPPTRVERYSGMVEAGIDAETQGDQSIELAEKLFQAIRTCELSSGLLAIGIIAPRFGQPWGDENRLLIPALARRLAALRSGLLIFADAGSTPDDLARFEHARPESAAMPVTPQPGLAAILPGIVTPEFVPFFPHIGELGTPLRRGCWFIPPAARKDPAKVSKLDFDAYAGLPAVPPWFAAYCQYHGNNLHLEPSSLVAQGWASFAGGGKELGLRLLGRARDCEPDPVRRAAIVCQQQGMRIADLRFAEAANEDPPGTGLPDQIRAFLQMSKGWGKVLVGEFAVGDQLLQGAQAMAGVSGPERLFMLNIRALARYRLGDISTATAYEHEIEKCLEDSPGKDLFQLKYVNAINQARIAARQGDLSAASVCYERAFDTVRGLMTESDRLYSNFCRASLADAAGDQERALLFWLRAALCWLSSPVPDGISKRLTGILTSQRTGSAGSSLEAIAAVFENAITRLAGHRAEPAASKASGFFRTDMLVDGGIERHAVVGVPGLYLLTASTRAAPLTPLEPLQPLARLVGAVLGHLLPGGVMEGADALGVDTFAGRDLQSSIDEALALCVRLAVGKLISPEGVRMLSEAERSRLEAEMWVLPGDGVASVRQDEKAISITFKRYRSPVSLVNSAQLRHCLLGAPRRLEALQPLEPDIVPWARALEREGIIRLSLDPEQKR